MVSFEQSLAYFGGDQAVLESKSSGNVDAFITSLEQHANWGEQLADPDNSPLSTLPTLPITVRTPLF
jgi:hypothetical protein